MAGDAAAAKEITRAETRGSLALWFGILGAPLAWTAQVIIAPDLVEILCYPGAAETGLGLLYGLPVEIFLVVLTAAMALIGIAGLLVSLSCARRLRRQGDSSIGGRARWMALAGIFVSGLFTIAIVIGFFPMLFLSACEVAP